MTDIPIPPEVVEAVTRVIDRYMEGGITYYEGETPAHAALRAALAAWPGMHHYIPNAEPYYGKHIILPLQEPKT